MGIGEMRQGERFSGRALVVAGWNAFLRRSTLWVFIGISGISAGRRTIRSGDKPHKDACNCSDRAYGPKCHLEDAAIG
jgi:hypothetical protein